MIGRRLTKPSQPHRPWLAPALCMCWSCAKVILGLRCPFTWLDHHQGIHFYPAGQCGDYRGHRQGHTALVASTFTDAAEIVRLDGPQWPAVAP